MDKANKIVVVIENKVLALERENKVNDDGQLNKYKNTINRKYSDNEYEKYFIFLTPDLIKPSYEEYWSSAKPDMKLSLYCDRIK